MEEAQWPDGQPFAGVTRRCADTACPTASLLREGQHRGVGCAQGWDEGCVRILVSTDQIRGSCWSLSSLCSLSSLRSLSATTPCGAAAKV